MPPQYNAHVVAWLKNRIIRLEIGQDYRRTKHAIWRRPMDARDMLFLSRSYDGFVEPDEAPSPVHPMPPLDQDERDLGCGAIWKQVVRRDDDDD
jgi:hypothetical protein